MTERVAIVGSRDFAALFLVSEYVRTLPPGTIVVSGAARGVDRAAAQAAKASGLHVHEIPAHWTKHGKRAGFLRNTTIVQNCDRVVAFWDGKSRGTLDTITKAREAGKPVRVIPEPSR